MKIISTREATQRIISPLMWYSQNQSSFGPQRPAPAMEAAARSHTVAIAAWVAEAVRNEQTPAHPDDVARWAVAIADSAIRRPTIMTLDYRT